MACIDNTETLSLTVTGGVLSGDVIVDPDPANALAAGVAGLFVVAANQTGWFSADETWLFSGADAPSFAFSVVGDSTGRYSPGMRIRLKQGGSYLYFIVTGVAYDGASSLTTVTMYGGTDYVLTNAAISDNDFSTSKVPAGFPADPLKWTVELRDTADRSQAAPTSGTWYNLGALSITIPVGVWDVYYMGVLRAIYSPGSQIDVRATLSSGSSTESDTDFTTAGEIGNSANAASRVTPPIHRRKTLALAAKTVYYMNARAGGSCTSIVFMGSTYAPTIVRAVSALL